VPFVPAKERDLDREPARPSGETHVPLVRLQRPGLGPEGDDVSAAIINLGNNLASWDDIDWDRVVVIHPGRQQDLSKMHSTILVLDTGVQIHIEQSLENARHRRAAHMVTRAALEKTRQELAEAKKALHDFHNSYLKDRTQRLKEEAGLVTTCFDRGGVCTGNPCTVCGRS
jgi:hypothetical protein